MLRRKFKTSAIPKNSWISADALAQILGCSLRTVKEWVKNDGIHYKKVGQIWLIDLSTA